MQSKQERVGLRPHPFLCIAILAGCASQLSVPVVTITQVSAIAPLRISAHTAVPVDYRLEITNPLDNAVTLKSVEIETVGYSGGYTMKRVRHAFARTIPPHAKTTLDLRAWVRPLQDTDTGVVVTPVLLRGTARFESLGKMIQSSFTARASQRG
jgi:hypothetical protein